MCSLFQQRMEKDQGDLADIVRARAGGGGGTCDSTSNNHISTDWQFPSEPIKFPSVIEEPIDNFGDPFSMIQDPLLHELDLTGSAFFDNSNSLGHDHDRGPVEMNVEDDPTTTSNSSSSCQSLLAQRILDEEMKRPCNFFSRILQISPNTSLPISPRDISTVVSTAAVVSSPRGMSSTTTTTTSSSSLVVNDQLQHHHHMGKPGSSTGCSVDNSSTGMQISLSRSPAGIKRRKSQAKKVVCIPAPAAVNSRPSGEVVPSDLWAWRKYGQKPIKGSPYPRGYYRCSSSKGCSARKQVERSRTDPNMLVITYTSEHNHPWPTQRNALAGSTRSQPMKNTTTTTTTNVAAAAGSKRSQSSHQTSSKHTNSVLKEELKEKSNEINASIAMIPGAGGSTTSTISSSIKEEMEDTEEKTSMDIYCDGDHQFSSTQSFHDHYSQYSILPAGTGEDMMNHADDFFADLGELEPDPLINHLLFSSELGGSGGFEDQNISDDIVDNPKMIENKVALPDPFSLFDWTDNNNNNNNINNNSISTFEESSRRGL